MLKKNLSVILLVFLSFTLAAKNLPPISKETQTQIFEEAEELIDDMPEGLQDKITDAVLHAIRGFFSEISYLRGVSTKPEISDSIVSVKNIKNESGIPLSLNVYTANEGFRTESPLLIYFHGGGWSLGSSAVADNFCRKLAANGKINIISIDYPLAPEISYGQIIKRCEETLKYLLKNISYYGLTPSSISLGGDGAGANIAIKSSQSLLDSIKSLVLYYPLTGERIDKSSEARQKFGRGFGLDFRLLDSFYAALGLQETKITDEETRAELNEITPIIEKKEIIALPPILLISAGRDIIADTVDVFVANLESKENEIVVFEGAIHGFITDGKQKTALNKAVELTEAFLTEK